MQEIADKINKKIQL